MNIAFHFFSNQVSFLFKEYLIPSLTAQQKKILIIATVALSFLALCYSIRCCYFSAKPLDSDSPKDPPQSTPPKDPPTTPPFIWDDANSKELPEIPQGYEWLMLDGQKAKNFLKDAPDLSLVAGVAQSAFAHRHPFFSSCLLISDLIEHASLAQTKVIVEAVADHREQVRAIFRTLFFEREKNTSVIWKDKLQMTLEALSQEQLMDILAIRRQESYQFEQIEIESIPLEQFLKLHDDLNLPHEFVNGCHQLMEYAKYVKLEAAKEPEIICG